MVVSVNLSEGNMSDASGDDRSSLTEADFFDDDETPWADPKIQADYETALGRFVVEFNRLDDTVSTVLAYALAMIDRTHLTKEYMQSQFSHRIAVIDLLGGSNILGLASAPIAAMKGIANIRNTLVHAHFDQNPFDGSYKLIQKGRDSKLKTETINKWTKKTSEVIHKMRHYEAVYMFRDIKVPDQPA